MPCPCNARPTLRILKVALDQFGHLLRRFIHRYLASRLQQLFHPPHVIHQLKPAGGRNLKGASIQASPPRLGIMAIEIDRAGRIHLRHLVRRELFALKAVAPLFSELTDQKAGPSGSPDPKSRLLHEAFHDPTATFKVHPNKTDGRLIETSLRLSNRLRVIESRIGRAGKKARTLDSTFFEGAEIVVVKHEDSVIKRQAVHKIPPTPLPF